MTPQEILFASATTLARALRDGNLSSETVIATYLERLLAVNPTLNAVLQIAPVSALEQARAADAARTRGEALALQILSGFDPHDPTTLPLPPPDYYRKVRLLGLRVAFFTDNGIVPPTPETSESVRAAARGLEAAGAIVTERPLPDAAESWEVTNEYWRYCREEGEVADYFRFLRRWDRYRVRLLDYQQEWDALICPAEAFPAPLIGAETPPMFTYTTPFSLVGWPCAVVRGGASLEGLPLGIQVVAPSLRDDIALAVASAIESLPDCGYHPPISP